MEYIKKAEEAARLEGQAAEMAARTRVMAGMERGLRAYNHYGKEVGSSLQRRADLH